MVNRGKRKVGKKSFDGQKAAPWWECQINLSAIVIVIVIEMEQLIWGIIIVAHPLFHSIHSIQTGSQVSKDDDLSINAIWNVSSHSQYMQRHDFLLSQRPIWERNPLRSCKSYRVLGLPQSVDSSPRVPHSESLFVTCHNCMVFFFFFFLP